MISRNEIKLIRSLDRKKFRDEVGLIVVEGEKSVAGLDSFDSGGKTAEFFTEPSGSDFAALFVGKDSGNGISRADRGRFRRDGKTELI